MWIIGLLLLAAAIVVGVDISINNDQSIDLEAFNHVWTSTPAVAFGVGVVTALVGIVGLLMFFGGMRHSRVRRRERRAEMAERDRLADERRRELDSMATANRDSGDRTMEARPEHVDRDMDRERVARDNDTVDVRDREDLGDRDEAEPRERHGILHRSRD
jgi:uncharacterized membrane protein YciS (DUF1049 family)